MTTGVVVGRILLTGDQLLRVEELAVRSSSHLIHYGRFQVYKHCPRDVLSGACLAEEGVEGVVATSDGLIGWHVTIRLDSVLQAVELPTGISDLDACLTNVH